MKTTEKAIAQMERWAEDDSHGYDQQYRWGERGDYDCSSAVITAWERAGVPVLAAGASYTGNMYAAFLSCGFEDVTAIVNRVTGSGLKRGDVLLNHQRHTAMYCGDGLEVEASINERGGVTGGQPGDQTGREFLIRPYRNYPWDCVLRYTGGEKAPEKLPEPCTVELPVLRRGDTGAAVAAAQGALRYRGLDPTWIDGDFGNRTEVRTKQFQDSTGLEPDGVIGAATWAALMKKSQIFRR